MESNFRLKNNLFPSDSIIDSAGIKCDSFSIIRKIYSKAGYELSLILNAQKR
ncbi:hypothetical protein LEP1GSC047_1007 [Leptospira inadai serovar Lyme str. 10]|uniref:Uncharacterized protein n=2 Tax=Leptospira inadai serovar Lyme TaxID=293084 RepID=V6HQZ6_9LEPT|nr:hypothetical protein [Leptospira inadai]EQA34889.1 hypothetical protein LEP1GSC047_1007 [Leptospira inadai serovar Lyme str. 10]